jgi:hypothetical protein
MLGLRLATRLCTRAAPKLAPLGCASLHTSRPVFNSITAEERKATGTIVDTPGVIDHYGTIPFFGLLATALITKEVFIFNEEALLALNTVTAATVGYIGIGDSLDKHFDGERAADNARFHDSFACAIEQVNLYKQIESKKLEKVGVIKDLCKESREVNEAYVKFLNLKVRHDARNAMVAKLEAIQKREAGEEAAAYQEYVTDSIEEMRARYTSDAGASLRAASLKYAIDNIGNVTAEEADPFRVELNKLLEEAEEE